jgi:hypothetical protein
MVAAHQSGRHQGRMNNLSSKDVRVWPFSFSPVGSRPLRAGADTGQPIGLGFGQTRLGAAPPTRRVALYLAAKRPLDRARKRSRPVLVTIAPPRTSAGIMNYNFGVAANRKLQRYDIVEVWTRPI